MVNRANMAKQIETSPKRGKNMKHGIKSSRNMRGRGRGDDKIAEKRAYKDKQRTLRGRGRGGITDPEPSPPREPQRPRRTPDFLRKRITPGNKKGPRDERLDPIRPPRMKSGGCVSKSKKYASGGKVRGAGCVKKGVRPAKHY